MIENHSGFLGIQFENIDTMLINLSLNAWENRKNNYVPGTGNDFNTQN